MPRTFGIVRNFFISHNDEPAASTLCTVVRVVLIRVHTSENPTDFSAGLS